MWRGQNLRWISSPKRVQSGTGDTNRPVCPQPPPQHIGPMRRACRAAQREEQTQSPRWLAGPTWPSSAPFSSLTCLPNPCPHAQLPSQGRPDAGSQSYPTGSEPLSVPLLFGAFPPARKGVEVLNYPSPESSGMRETSFSSRPAWGRRLGPADQVLPHLIGPHGRGWRVGWG